LGKINDELDLLFNYIERLNDEEDKKYGGSRIKDKETKNYGIEEIDKMINGLDKIIKGKDLSKEVRKKLAPALHFLDNPIVSS
jgi:hypothetical protein